MARQTDSLPLFSGFAKRSQSLFAQGFEHFGSTDWAACYGVSGCQ